jgi:Uma2 family endonuclease
MSLEEFLARADEKPYLEYVDGEVFEKPLPKRKHWMLMDEIAGALRDYRRMHGGRSGSEAHLNLSRGQRRIYRVPDVAYWVPDKPLGDDEISLPSTLAVEIRSPGQTLGALREKCRFMREHGVDVCWLVIPETRTVEVFEGGIEVTLSGDAVLTSPHLPGFVLPLQDLFAVLDH